MPPTLECYDCGYYCTIGKLIKRQLKGQHFEITVTDLAPYTHTKKPNAKAYIDQVIENAKKSPHENSAGSGVCAISGLSISHSCKKT
jgi:hypothetical protein